MLEPKEITKDIDSGMEVASFDYYTGIAYAKQNNLLQNSNGFHKGSFLVCCGDVMTEVDSTDFPEIERRSF